MQPAFYEIIEELLSREDSPENLNLVASLLLFNEHFEEACAVFKYNYVKHNDEKAKSYVENFEFVNEYINDFNKALESAKKKKYKKAIEFIKPYYEREFITISGLKLYAICLAKLGRDKELELVVKQAQRLGYSDEFDKIMLLRRIDFQKMLNAAVLLALIPILVLGVYFAKTTNTEPKIVYKEVPKTEIVYQTKTEYVKDLTFEKTKEALGIELVRSLYKAGLKAYKNKKYDKAYEYLSIANEISAGTYLERHVLYFLAKAAEHINKDDATDLYKEFISKYEKGPYSDEALYSLTMLLYDSRNIEEAKKYASRIDRESIFFNSKIRVLLEGGQR